MIDVYGPDGALAAQVVTGKEACWWITPSWDRRWRAEEIPGVEVG